MSAEKNSPAWLRVTAAIAGAEADEKLAREYRSMLELRRQAETRGLGSTVLIPGPDGHFVRQYSISPTEVRRVR